MYKNKIISLHKVDVCPICRSSELIKSIKRVSDNVSFAVDYEGSIMQCSNCGHAFLSPVIDSDELHLAYDDYYTQNKHNLDNPSSAKNDKFSFFAKFYEYRFKSFFSLKGIVINFLSKIIPFLNYFLMRAVRFLPIPSENSKLTLLDVGCGRGDFLVRSQFCGYIATGIDFDPKTIDLANHRGLTAIVSEIQDLPESFKYDVISLSHVIEHVKDPEAMLKEIYLRLKVGGYFYIATPNFNSAGRRTFGRYWRGCDAPRHFHFFNMQQLESILSDIGFSRVEKVYDLPQSLICIKSSMRLKYVSGISIFNLITELRGLLKNKFLSPDRLDISVFRCYKDN